MPGLITESFELPNNISQGIFKKAQTGSALARLSGSKPQKFGTHQAWVLTGEPRAEFVGEAAAASPTPTTYAPKPINPLKAQVTVRYSEEVRMADEDVQIGVLQDMGDNCGIALGRALDLAAIHKINPLTGVTSSLIDKGMIDCDHSVVLANGKYDELVEAGASAIIASGYANTGIAMDPALSFGIATQRDGDSKHLYPGIGFGQGLTSFQGINTAVSDTVSGSKELAVKGNLIGVIGQFDAFRWGVQRAINVELVEYGDPDGLGDLKRMGQIALKATIIYGIGIMADDAFCKLMKA
ncbi:MAG: phage major capsid protein [Lachnospiraceae bacterium]|nr:phage major capsid protein [Lachnospiraceae bacterium]